MDATPKAMLCRDWSFSEETLEQWRTRYAGFGSQLYEMIHDQIPTAFSKLRFYQSDLHQANDSYAICEVEPPFSIQLDPDIEVIVLGGKGAHTEIGAWATNPCGDAINFIRQHFIEQNGEQADAVQPATAVPSRAEGNEKPKPESEGRSQ